MKEKPEEELRNSVDFLADTKEEYQIFCSTEFEYEFLRGYQRWWKKQREDYTESAIKTKVEELRNRRKVRKALYGF